jgi:hypothetical protein
MRNVEPKESQHIETIDQDLDTVTGGFAVGGCYGGGSGPGGRAVYTRTSGFGFDPMFLLFAMSLFSNSSTK